MARRAGIVRALIERRDPLIGALLIGNHLANILSSSIATSLFLGLFGNSGVALATLAMTVILVIFAEVLPKSWAISAPDRFALNVAPWVRIFVAVVGPLSSFVNAIVRRILALFGVNLSKEVSMLSAHEELRGAVDFLHREGSVVKADRDRLGGLLDLGELELSDIMVHRTAMLPSMPTICRRSWCAPICLKAPTRMPLWRGTIDNIIGVVHAKDLLGPCRAERRAENLDIVKIARSHGSCPTAPASKTSSMPSCAASSTLPSSSTSTAKCRGS